MKIGIVGAGFMGGVHAAGWAAAGADLVAVASHPDHPPVELAERYGMKVCDTLEDLLGRVDVVDVCAPTNVHDEVALAAAAAGRHVVCEKPLARTPARAEAMTAACDAAGVRLLPAHVVRFFPEYAAAKAAVDRGAVGIPAVLRFTRGTSLPQKRFDNWYTDQARSGGLVLDLMVHDFDIARWVAGDVTTVFAKGLSTRPPDSGVDHCLAVLTHASGAITHVEGSWAYPPPVFRTRFEIAGTTGLIEHDSDRDAPVAALVSAAGGDAPEVPLPASPLAVPPHTAELEHFLAVLRGEAEPVVTAADGLEALRIATAAAESLSSGRVATVRPEGAA